MSIFLSLFLFCFVIYVLVAMVVSQVLSSVRTLAEAMPGYVLTITGWLEGLINEEMAPAMNYLEQYSEDIINWIQDFARTQLFPQY